MLNFNVDPYYDDFDPSKNFHRILFKPGYAVQGRELTQAQTLLQSQISKFADHIFKQNTPVKGGKVTINTNCYYIKLNRQYGVKNIVASDFINKYITDDSGLVLAKVIKTAEQTGTDVAAGDPPTLIVNYLSGVRFTDGMHLYPTDGTSLDATTIGTVSGATTCTGLSSVASISDGIFYIVNGYSVSKTRNSDGTFSKFSIGNFVSVQPDTIILNKYSSTPSYRIGLSINESIVDSYGDKSLLDPAVGASNYQAPGADRYYIKLGLTALPLTIGNDDQFIELTRIDTGNIVKQTDETVYATIDEYIAKRTYETNGDYVVNNFKLTPSANTYAGEKYILSVGPGQAYVQGYRAENQSTLKIDSTRARTVDYANNNSNLIDYGSYFYVSSVKGNNSTFFDTTTSEKVYLHTVSNTNIATTNTTTFNSTVSATAYIRNIVYDSSTSDTDTTKWVYKAYLYDITTQNLSGTIAAGASSTQATLVDTNGKFSSVTGAYVGVTFTIDSGTGAGYTGKITAYSGRQVTVTPQFPTTPDTTSNFSLRFNTTDTESIIKSTIATPCVLSGWASIDTLRGKDGGIASGDALFKNPGTPELLFPLGQQYVAGTADSSYTTFQEFRGQSFAVYSSGASRYLQLDSAVTGTFDFPRSGTTEDVDVAKQNFMVVVTDRKTNTTIQNGDIIYFNGANRSIAVDSDKNGVRFIALDLSPFDATILIKMNVTNADSTNSILKTKTLISANTSYVSSSWPDGIVNNTSIDLSKGQIYVAANAISSFGTKQNLYVSDVTAIVKIIDTRGLVPNISMYTDASYDVTSYYTFDDGQTDNYYGQASISLKPGAPKPSSLWVLFNYYQHSGGDGYFSASSYDSSGFGVRPTYTSRHGITYQLKDCLDFRPAVKNAQSSFVFNYKVTPTTTNNSGLFLPVDLTNFTCDYSYYLGRKDLLVLGKDSKFQIIYGTPSDNPVFPPEPEGSLVIAKITLDPYTAYIPGEIIGQQANLSIQPVLHKRWQMSDITDLQSRINNLEYYTSLNMVEQKATNLQIPDASGLNRFKNGILVDDFTTFSVADTFNSDFSASINTRTKQLMPALVVKNFELQNNELLSAVNNSKLSANTINGLSYKPNITGKSHIFSMPYTETIIANQQLASRDVNINPFSVSRNEGTLQLTPPMDNWIDTSAEPALLFTGVQSYKATDTTNLLAGDPTLRINSWATIPGSKTETIKAWEDANFTYKETIVSDIRQNQYTYGNWQQTYQQSGNYITDISLLPFIRSQRLSFNSTGLLFNTTLNAFFDGNLVTSMIRRANVLELTNVSGTFNVGDVIGYGTNPSFAKTGEVLDVYKYSDGRVRLYVNSDTGTTTYTNTGTLVNQFYNTSGTQQGSTASGTLSSVKHYSAALGSSGSSTTSVQLSAGASATDIYSGKKLNIVSKRGQSTTIQSYNTSTKVATVSPAITFASGDVYSIGDIVSNEIGSVCGVFYLPSNSFHTGERVLRLDNRIITNTNINFKYPNGTETTWAEGTFYATGLQTKSQELNFSASIQTAKNTLTSTTAAAKYTISDTTVATRKFTDPVAQTFKIDSANYPNGAFLSSINVFFRTKSTTNVPVQLYIVPTQNGYPGGKSLDYSNVYLDSTKVNEPSENPHYKNSATYTTFTFPAPVYISPDVLYAFIVQSASAEYTLWCAAQNDFALISSSKAEYTDSNPTNATKIGTAPYVGAMFESQNSMTWTADQGKALMFTINRCKFTTDATSTLSFVVPAGLPERKSIDISAATATSNVIYDAFNVSSTDFTPPSTGVTYAYTTTINSTGAKDGAYAINPGKYGTPLIDNIKMNDSKGERVLDYNTNLSFKLDVALTSSDDAVSPVVSDDGVNLYTVRNRINNLPLSNSNITIVGGGRGYLANGSGTLSSPDIVVSSPDDTAGSRAYVSATVVSGNITSVYVTTAGSGYTKTPTISVVAANTVTASVVVNGETSSSGGNGYARYLTKPVTLAAGNDSGDIRVFLSAYRPVRTGLYVYYKLVAREDSMKIDDADWQLMTIINGDAKYSTNENDIFEYEAAPGTSGIADNSIKYTSKITGQTYTSYYQYAIKIVMSSSDPTFTPALNDIRVIALPSGTGL
jgi:hypothetical protein